MAENKTRQTKESVTAFLARAAKDERHRDCVALVKLMEQVTGEKARMWGPAIVGFGSYHYVYESGREGDMPLASFSPRKGDLTLYFMGGFDRSPELMKKLGKHKTSKGCLYLKRLADVDMKVLKALVTESVRYMRKKPS